MSHNSRPVMNIMISVDLNSKQHEEQPVVESIQKRLISVRSELGFETDKLPFCFLVPWANFFLMHTFTKLKFFKDSGFVCSSSSPSVGTRPLFLSPHVPDRGWANSGPEAKTNLPLLGK